MSENYCTGVKCSAYNTEFCNKHCMFKGKYKPKERKILKGENIWYLIIFAVLVVGLIFVAWEWSYPMVIPIAFMMVVVGLRGVFRIIIRKIKNRGKNANQ